MSKKKTHAALGPNDKSIRTARQMMKIMENAMVAVATPPYLRAPTMFIVVAAVINTNASSVFALEACALAPHPSYHTRERNIGQHPIRFQRLIQ
jgi:hypothetical protein